MKMWHFIQNSIMGKVRKANNYKEESYKIFYRNIYWQKQNYILKKVSTENFPTSFTSFFSK